MTKDETKIEIRHLVSYKEQILHNRDNLTGTNNA